MTVLSAVNKVIFEGNGAIGTPGHVFSYSFEIPTADVAVVTYVDTAGASTTISNQQYAITGVGNPDGGTLTYPLGSATAIPAGSTVTLERIVPYTQPVALGNQSAYYPDVVEGADDNIVFQTQQLAEQQNRTIQFPATDTAGHAAGELPAWQLRANTGLAFDSNGNPVAGSTPSVVVSSAMAPVVQAASIAAGRAVLLAMRQPCVTLVATGLNTTGASVQVWELYDEDGAAINISASTTSGLQEALDYALDNGKSLIVYGGASGTAALGADNGILSCTTGVTFPPLRDASIIMLGVHIVASAAVTGDFVTIDSTMNSEIIIIGEITYVGNAAALRFRPTTGVPVDGSIGIGTLRFFLGAVALLGGTNPIGVRFTSGTAGISTNNIYIQEILGANGASVKASTALQIDTPASPGTFFNNTITVDDIHEFNNFGMSIGQGTASGTLSGNMYIGNISSVHSTAGTAADVWSNGDFFNIRIGTAIAGGIKLNAPASKNQFIVPVNAALTPVIDSSTDKSNRGMWGITDGYGGSTAATAALAIGTAGSVWTITGTAAITSMAVSGPQRNLTMIFSASAGMTDGSNLKLAGNFTASTNGSMSGFWDGTNFYETSRSLN